MDDHTNKMIDYKAILKEKGLPEELLKAVDAVPKEVVEAIAEEVDKQEIEDERELYKAALKEGNLTKPHKPHHHDTI